MKKGALISIFLMALILVLPGCGKKKVENTNTNISEEPAGLSQEEIQTQIDLTLLLEDAFGLKEVIISQDNKNYIVRFKAPTLKGTELDNGLTQIFGFLNPRVPDGIKNIKLIFTVNHIDSAVITVERQNITDWLDKKIPNAAFINSFEVVSLL